MYQKTSAINFIKEENKEIELFVQVHYDRIYKYCFRILRNIQDAEDAVQEIFMKAINSGKLSKVENESAWLFKISYFHCLNKIKRQRILAFIPFTDQNDSSLVVENQYEDELQFILVRLKPEERVLVVLRIIEGYSFEEIALIIEKPSATIRKRYERLKAKIKSILEEDVRS